MPMNSAIYTSTYKDGVNSDPSAVGKQSTQFIPKISIVLNIVIYTVDARRTRTLTAPFLVFSRVEPSRPLRQIE